MTTRTLKTLLITWIVIVVSFVAYVCTDAVLTNQKQIKEQESFTYVIEHLPTGRKFICRWEFGKGYMLKDGGEFHIGKDPYVVTKLESNDN